MDHDKNGTVSYHEFRKGLHRLGVALSEGSIMQLFSVFDVDDNGALTMEVWVTCLGSAHNRAGSRSGLGLGWRGGKSA